MPGATIELEFGDFPGTVERVSHNYRPLADEVAPGGRILLDDGLLALAVESIDGPRVCCRVVTGGPLRDHKGMNLPGARLSAPALTDKDRDDLAFALGLGVDYFALSFVRRADDVLQAKELAGRRAGDRQDRKARGGSKRWTRSSTPPTGSWSRAATWASRPGSRRSR